MNSAPKLMTFLALMLFSMSSFAGETIVGDVQSQTPIKVESFEGYPRKKLRREEVRINAPLAKFALWDTGRNIQIETAQERNYDAGACSDLRTYGISTTQPIYLGVIIKGQPATLTVAAPARIFIMGCDNLGNIQGIQIDGYEIAVDEAGSVINRNRIDAEHLSQRRQVAKVMAEYRALIRDQNWFATRQKLQEARNLHWLLSESVKLQNLRTQKVPADEQGVTDSNGKLAEVNALLGVDVTTLRNSEFAEILDMYLSIYRNEKNYVATAYALDMLSESNLPKSRKISVYKTAITTYINGLVAYVQEKKTLSQLDLKVDSGLIITQASEYLTEFLKEEALLDLLKTETAKLTTVIAPYRSSRPRSSVEFLEQRLQKRITEIESYLTKRKK